MEPVIPDKHDIARAKKSCQILAGLLDSNPDLKELELEDPSSLIKITIPASASFMLLDILMQMSKGNAVSIVPIHAELTTQEAAELLKVSRPFIIKELKAGKVPYRMVGNRRKILYKDLIVYKEAMYRDRLNTLDQLTSESQDLDLDY